MKRRSSLAILVTLIALVPPAFADSKDASPATAASPSLAGAFQSLSPGDQKIARALFEAQQPTATGPAPLSLNQIAVRKGETGWGRVFDQLKSEGLVSSKNLGQIVSTLDHHGVPAHKSAQKSGGTPKTIITNGSGQTFALNAANGDHGSVGAGTAAENHGGGKGSAASENGRAR